jgi:YhcH/YjgK/YiaL family protein
MIISHFDSKEFDGIKKAHPLFGKAFDALAELVAGDVTDGRHDVAGDDAYIMVSTYETNPVNEERRFETHRDYIDIQLLLEGRELINIHYDPQAKVYVACAFQNEIFYVYDKDFKLTNSFKAFMSPGPVREYSLQGCITDGVYVYVLEWHGGQRWGELRGRGGATTETSTSHFNVFDIKTGEHVAVIDTGIPREIEYAAYVDGKFYVGCNRIDWNGLEVWEMTVETEL